MPTSETLTGHAKLDQDLCELLECLQDDEQLRRTQQVLQDETATLAQLMDAMPGDTLRLALTLLDSDQSAALLDALEEQDKGRQAVEKAIALVSEQLSGLGRHPAVVDAMRKELKELVNQKAKGAASEENTITGVSWEGLLRNKGSELRPSIRLRLRDDSERLLLASTMDWDDIAFLIQALGNVLQRHMDMSHGALEAELLTVANPEQMGQSLHDASEVLKRIIEAAPEFHIPITQSPDGEQG